MARSFITIGEAVSYIRNYVKRDFEKTYLDITPNLKTVIPHCRSLAKINYDLAILNKKDYHAYMFVTDIGSIYFEDEDKEPEFDNREVFLEFKFIYRFHLYSAYREGVFHLDMANL